MNSKIAFITGAASGIGRATAEHLFQQGWSLGLADLNLEALTEFSQSWSQVRVAIYELDVSDAKQTQCIISEFCGLHNEQLNVLINCAGILRMGRFEEISPEDHQLIFDINVMGTINTCQSAFRFLKETKGATVINLSSVSSMHGIPEFASYSASKFAIKGLTEALELEWKTHNITVCDIAPPFINTHMMASQTNGAKVLDAMGIHLEAKDVVKVISKQINSSKLHRTVGLKFKVLYFLNELAPSNLTRLLVKFLAH